MDYFDTKCRYLTKNLRVWGEIHTRHFPWRISRNPYNLLVAEGKEHIGHQLPLEILCMFIGCLTVYSALFATGFWIYDNILPANIAMVVAAIGAFFLFKIWGKLKVN